LTSCNIEHKDGKKEEIRKKTAVKWRRRAGLTLKPRAKEL